MPLPSTYDRAELVIGGRRYDLRGINITAQEMSQDVDTMRGVGGRVVARTQGRLTERISLEAELIEMPGIDSRDAAISAGYGAPLRVTPSQAGLMPLGTFTTDSTDDEPEPLTLAAVEAAAASIRTQADLMLTNALQAGSSRLESDASVRDRIGQRLRGASWNNIAEATGEHLDQLAAMYGVERREASVSETLWYLASEAPKKDPPLKRALEELKPPTKTALDCILSDELEDGA